MIDGSKSRQIGADECVRLLNILHQPGSRCERFGCCKHGFRIEHGSMRKTRELNLDSIDPGDGGCHKIDINRRKKLVHLRQFRQ